MVPIVIFLGLFLHGTAALNFLALGDWGGQDSAPYYTQGQFDTASAMDKIAQKLDASFILAVGDNFYYNGVATENDSRFRDTFEAVYTHDSLQKPWYVIAGNHDYRGNVSAQIEYSGNSKRWTFPSKFYSKSFQGTDGATIDLIMIDTVMLASSTLKNEDEEGYFDPLPELPRSYASDHWAWIEAELAKSTADYLLVVGHYPVYSVCKHGPTATLVTHLRPLLQQYNAHYLSGHDHCMEYLVDTESKVNYFLSGMGEECCYPSSSKNRVPAGSLQWYIASDNKGSNTNGGFTSFEVSKSAMVVTYYDQDANVLYTTPVIPPRQ